jgi:YggT family protein
MDAILIALFQIIDLVLGLVVWALILSAILSWLVAFNVVDVRNQFISTVGNFLYRVTEPMLRPIRRYVPDFGGVDVSPVILILVIYFIRSVLRQWAVSGF